MKRDASKIANFTDQDRAAIVVRCLAGESEEDLAEELGVPQNVVEEWVRKAADSLKHKKVSESEAQKEKELQEKIKEKQEEVNRLRSQLVETMDMYKAHRTLQDARSTRHIFDR